MTEAKSLTGAFKVNYELVIALLYVYMLNPPGSGVIKKPIGHEMTGDMAVSYKLLAEELSLPHVKSCAKHLSFFC